MGPQSMDAQTFERQRLALFATHGFAGDSSWIGDSQSRHTYAIVEAYDCHESACPTLLIHGGLSDAGEWFAVARHIPDGIVIPDRPGCGLSFRIDYSGYDGAHYRRAAEEWLCALVEGLGARRVNIVANSMGGYFATAFASSHAERLRKLVFVGAPAGLDRPIPLFLRLWGNRIVGRGIGRMVLTMKSAEAVRKRVFPILSAHPERVPIEFLEVALAAQKLPGAELASRSMLRTVLDWRGWRKSMMMRDVLAAVDVPTLFVWGDRDAFAPPASGEDMAERMPDARIEVMPDAGHLPHIDQPDAVGRVIADFLSDR